MVAVISIAVFVCMLLLVAGGLDMFNLYRYGDASRTKARLQSLSDGGNALLEADVEIIRKNAMDKEKGILGILQERLGPTNRIKTLLMHADSQMPVGVFAMTSLLCAAGGGMFVMALGWGVPWVVGGSIVGLYAPWTYQKRKKKQRLAAIERQLPDALDLIARTLLAGHAFMIGLKMVGDQMEDPLAGEFRKVFEEINFGVSVGEAMKGFSARVDSLDVKFFTTSLLVQLETGGNLAEIIESISSLIRARFELLGKISALSAEGRISAGVMFALPIFVGAAIRAVNPKYLDLLFTDELGKSMVTTGLTMMVLGVLATRRMINIHV